MPDCLSNNDKIHVRFISGYHAHDCNHPPDEVCCHQDMRVSWNCDCLTSPFLNWTSRVLCRVYRTDAFTDDDEHHRAARASSSDSHRCAWLPRYLGHSVTLSLCISSSEMHGHRRDVTCVISDWTRWKASNRSTEKVRIE